jgi:hypothetical protein
MTGWRPFDPSREACMQAAIYAVGLTTPRACNRHGDCDAADKRTQAATGRPAEHCHDECCEECFGS